MEPTKEQIDALYCDDIRSARRMSFEDKLLAGPRLFDYACRVTKDGIRMQNPDFTDKEVDRELARRLALGRRLEDVG